MSEREQALNQLKAEFLHLIKEKYPDFESVFCFLCLDTPIGSIVGEVFGHEIKFALIRDFDCQQLSEKIEIQS